MFLMSENQTHNPNEEQQHNAAWLVPVCHDKLWLFPPTRRLGLISVPYLQHDHTDLFDTLDDGFWGSGDCHCTFCGIGQHVPRHLNLGPCGLEEFHTG